MRDYNILIIKFKFMSEANRKEFTVMVKATGQILGPFATQKEAEEQGSMAREKAIIEWCRQLLKRLIKEPELMRRIVALLALAEFEETRWNKPGPLSALTSLSRPNDWINTQETGVQGVTGHSPRPLVKYRQRIVDAILALDVDKE